MKHLLLTAALAFTLNSYSQVEVTTAPKKLYTDKSKEVIITQFYFDTDTMYGLSLRNSQYTYAIDIFSIMFESIEEIDTLMDYCLKSFNNPDDIYRGDLWSVRYFNSYAVMLTSSKSGKYMLINKKIINGVKTFIAGYSNN
jgi:hypothetical protein